MRNSRTIYITFIIGGLCVCLVAVVALFMITGYYKAQVPISYLPEIETKTQGKPEITRERVEIKNNWYNLVIDSLGKLEITSVDNEPILTSLTFYANYKGYDEIVGLDELMVRKISDSTVILSGKIKELADLNMTLYISADDPELLFRVNIKYHDSVVVMREALIADYRIPVTEVYLKNRDTETRPEYREYWLEKQGVRLGTGSRSSLIYNQGDISSLQLKTKTSEVVINLDYALDHPFMEIPFQEDGGGRWLDKSAAVYSPGDERTDEFAILLGYLPLQTPRLMLVPEGYLAAYVFTEHADGGNLRTHRAAYFGEENITDISMARGGFAGHDIPVTKSVFFEHFDAALSADNYPEEESERDYLDFLDQLYATGLFDLCLHTPENSNSNRSYMDTAISAMKQRFKTESWIDHGMFPGNNNRETMVADGLNPHSEFYTADLWERYGTRFFWSPAVEAIRFSRPGPSMKDEFMDLRFSSLSAELWRRYKYRTHYLGESAVTSFIKLAEGHFPMFELNSLQPLKGSALPTPLYWQNETVSRSIYSWTTEYVYHGLSNINTENQLEIEKRALDILVKDWGVFFNHGYYVRNGVDDNIISNINGTLVINPYFDQVLAYMDSLRDRGDLYLTTVKDLLSYWVLLGNLKFDYQPDGSIEIINENIEQIKGLSLVVRADGQKIILDGIEPKSRYCKNDIIFWFDMPSNSRKTLKFVY